MGDQPAMNEIEAAAHEAKRVREAADASDASRGKNDKGNWPLKIGIGIGIGSAALAAAVLFVNAQRRK